MTSTQSTLIPKLILLLDKAIRPLMVTVFLSIAASIAVVKWQQRQVHRTKEASTAYFKALENIGHGSDASVRETLRLVAEQYSDTTYASFSLLHLVNIAQDAGQHELAQDYLKQAITHCRNTKLKQNLELRLARMCLGSSPKYSVTLASPLVKSLSPLQAIQARLILIEAYHELNENTLAHKHLLDARIKLSTIPNTITQGRYALILDHLSQLLV